MSLKFPVMIAVQTHEHAELRNITDLIQEKIPADFTGICHAFCQHTTAALTINENADPDVVEDVLAELERLIPWFNPKFRHAEGNSAAHVKSSLLGPGIIVPVQHGRLLLGTWQGIYFCEFDGPRPRHVVVSLVHGA